jgi:uncharacterized protein YgiM (DUF1202 family)
MRIGDRSSTFLLTVITLILALAIGAVIPLASGSSPGGRPQPWTPPPSPTETDPPATATQFSASQAKLTAPAAPRLTATTTRATGTLTPTLRATGTLTPTLRATGTLTPTLRATGTLTPTLRATATLTATAVRAGAVLSPTVALTPRTAAPAPRAQVREGPLSLRTGPSQVQPAVGVAQVGQTYTVTARTADNAWLQVCCVNNEPAWLAAQFVAITGTIATLPVKP